MRHAQAHSLPGGRFREPPGTQPGSQDWTHPVCPSCLHPSNWLSPPTSTSSLLPLPNHLESLPPFLLPAPTSCVCGVCPQPKASLQPTRTAVAPSCSPAWSCPESLSWVAGGGSSLPPRLAEPQLHLVQGASQEEPLEGFRWESRWHSSRGPSSAINTGHSWPWTGQEQTPVLTLGASVGLSVQPGQRSAAPSGSWLMRTEDVVGGGSVSFEAKPIPAPHPAPPQRAFWSRPKAPEFGCRPAAPRPLTTWTGGWVSYRRPLPSSSPVCTYLGHLEQRLHFSVPLCQPPKGIRDLLKGFYGAISADKRKTPAGRG